MKEYKSNMKIGEGAMRKGKRMRRIFAAILALWLLSAPALGAESQPSPLVITIAGPYADSLSSAYEDPLREFLEEKFAISFVPLQIDDANASYAYRLRAAANEFPDIMLYDAQWDFLYFIQADSLRALPDVMSDYPHLRQYITYPYAKNLQYDGQIWGIPRSLYAEEQRLPGYCVLVYKEYLAQTGVEEPVTMEDWQAFFRAIREANPDVIPLAAQSPWAMFNFSYFYAPFANTWIWDTQTNSYVPGFYTQEYSQRIAALRTLWDEGLLDPDFMNVNCGRPSGVDRFLLGQAACIVYPTSVHVLQSELMHLWAQLYPDTPMEEKVEAFFLPCDAGGQYSEFHELNMSAIYFSANVSDEKLDRILQLLDYLCSPEGLLLRRWGLPEVDYTLQEGQPVSLLAEGTTLYDKYPSYCLLRILPNLDEDYIRSDPALPAFAAKVAEKCKEWEELCVSQQRHWTSMRANTILTDSGTYFNPNLTEISFRMLTAPEGVEACFEQIKEEFRAQGIEQLILKVTVSLLR